MWEFPEIRGTFWGGVPVIRIIVYWAAYWGHPILGNYHVHLERNRYDKEPNRMFRVQGYV